jgi:hypothetical protein
MGSLRNQKRKMTRAEFEVFMRAGSPHPYYGTLWEARDLNLLDIDPEDMTQEEIEEIAHQIGPRQKD